MDFGSTIQERVESTQCCVVYEKTSGQIRLVYETVTLEGGTQETEDEFRRTVLNALHQLPLQGISLDVDAHDLLLQRELLEPGIAYRVDVAKRSLVRIDGGAAAAP
ncbi:hypothetical protein ACFRI7_10390 [Streptomyces sp. NPDC056716]|uniref:hypothetical protein n=1 Tax=unclassified Streptomyces TaxID=2593676 RepID=UPI0036A903F4